MTHKFIVQRNEDDIVVTLPMISGIITVMTTVPPHHHPLACDVLSHLAAVITKESIESYGGENVEDIKKIVAAFQTGHPVGLGDPRFYIDDEGYITGEMHPSELWAIRISLEHLIGVLPEDGAMAQTIETWVAAGELVTAMERFAAGPEDGMIVQ